MQSDDRLFATVGLTVLVAAVAVAVALAGGSRWRGPRPGSDDWSVSASVPQVAPEPTMVEQVVDEPAGVTLAIGASLPDGSAPAAASAALHHDLGDLLTAADAIAAGEVPAAWLDAVDGSSEVVVRRTADDRLVLAAGTFRRYSGLVAAMTGLEPAAIAAAFADAAGPGRDGVQRASLGSPPSTRLAAALDHLLAAPEVAQPAAMVSRGGRWVFADPALAALSPAQQQLVLMGPEHAATVRAVLTALRGELATELPMAPTTASETQDLLAAAAFPPLSAVNREAVAMPIP